MNNGFEYSNQLNSHNHMHLFSFSFVLLVAKWAWREAGWHSGPYGANDEPGGAFCPGRPPNHAQMEGQEMVPVLDAIMCINTHIYTCSSIGMSRQTKRTLTLIVLYCTILCSILTHNDSSFLFVSYSTHQNVYQTLTFNLRF